MNPSCSSRQEEITRPGAALTLMMENIMKTFMYQAMKIENGLKQKIMATLLILPTGMMPPAAYRWMGKKYISTLTMATMELEIFTNVNSADTTGLRRKNFQAPS